ncbi:MAG: glycosyltransferase [Methanomicrobiales archaeon]|nr:glycosyltransferase [Methanomicrobiales archaeon]
MLKVVIIGPSQRFLSGISYVTLLLSNSLADYFSVTALLFRDMLPKKLFPGYKRVGASLADCGYRSDIAMVELLDWYNPLTWVEASKYIRRGDVIIFQWWTSSVAHMYLAIALMNLKKKPIIIEFHEIVDPLEHGFFVLRLYSKILGTLIRRLATFYIVHSEIDRQLISSHYDIDLRRIRVIPIGLFDQYKKTDKGQAKDYLGIREPNVILFFGLIRPYKGVKYLVQAFERLPPDRIHNSHLLIVGEAWEDQELCKTVAKSPVNTHISLIDRYVGDSEIPFYFSAADVLVMPYTRASQSGVAHIGMEFGIPIIATRVGGLEESLGKYEGTRFINPMDPDELATVIEETISGKQLFEPPGELRWDVIAEQWNDLINFLQSDKKI